MLDYVVDLLQCPACGGSLTWQVHEREAKRILIAQANCSECSADYPVRDGIGVFLTPDLPREDLWEQVDDRLLQHLEQNPDTERHLMDVSVERLSPADRFFRAMVHEARGEFTQAKAILDEVNAGLYTPEYLACFESQIDFAIQQILESKDPIVDLATGRGDFIQAVLPHQPRPLIASDFSLNVLRRNRRWLQFLDLYEWVSLLAFDARRTPFKNGAVGTMTTNQGLANIREPGVLLQELRRVVADKFLAISVFYPPQDRENAEVIQQFGLTAMLYRSSAERHFTKAGWRLRAENCCTSRALPTPSAEILVGAGIDGLPVVETTLEWCTLIAT
jgi:uncharacterized protein YbaR (Trm112 family)